MTVISRMEVEELLFLEASLLDKWDLDAWAALFTDDASYLVPSTDVPDADPDKQTMIIDDDHDRILARVRRLKSRHAHREYPTSRTRHVVTNVMITKRSEDKLDVEAAFTVWRFRDGRSDCFVGSYKYILVSTDAGLRIKCKRATLDLTSLSEQGAVSVIL